MRFWIAAIISLTCGFGFGQETSAWKTAKASAPGVQYQTFESKFAGGSVSYHIYLPEAYGKDPERRFPVLYWLHGTGGGVPGIAPVSAFFARAMREGKVPPMFIVFANGMASSMWCDSADGTVPMESVVIKELLPHIDSTYRTISTRHGRVIEGFSMGGYGAARLGFKHHQLFSAISILASGPLDLEFQGPRATGNPQERQRILQSVYGGDLANFKKESPWTIAEQSAGSLREGTRIRVLVGDRDFTAELNRKFASHLKDLRIPCDFIEAPGIGHNSLQLLAALGDKNWAFYRTALAPSSGSEAGK
jgi:enterochelin esterase-like enzyme